MLRKVLIIGGILFGIAIPVLKGCCERVVQNRFLYSDGSEVKSTVALKAIEAELDSLKREQYFPPGVIVYTSLRKGCNDSIHQVVEQLKDTLYQQIIANNPGDTMMKRYGKENCTNAAVIVIEKSSGRILTYYSSSKRDAVQQPVICGGLNKTFVYALALQEELTPQSPYPSSEKDGPDHRSLKRTYITSPATILHGIYERYSTRKFSGFMNQIRSGAQIEIVDDFPTPLLQQYPISLLNAMNFYHAAGNKGVAFDHTLIDSVTNLSGKVLYRRTPKKHHLLDNKTASEIQELLGMYAQEGIGLLVRGRYNDTTFTAGNFAKTGTGNGSGWMFSIQDDMIIGIRHQLAYRNWRVGFHFDQPHSLNVPLWLKAKK